MTEQLVVTVGRKAKQTLNSSSFELDSKSAYSKDVRVVWELLLQLTWCRRRGVPPCCTVRGMLYRNEMDMFLILFPA